MENICPKYSIIIRCYDNEKYIERCIKSAINQTYKNFEIVVVDDQSRDNSFVICQNLAKNHHKIKLIQTEHKERTHARNTGLLNSRGKYVIYLDGDDWLEVNCLEICEHILNKYENKPEMIVCKWREINKENIYKKFQPTMANKDVMYNHEFIKNNVKKFIPYADLTASTYKRDMLINHYCKDESVIICEDNAFTYEALYSSRYIVFSESIIYNYNRTLYYGENKKTNFGVLEVSKLGNYVFDNLGKNNDKQLHQALTKWFYDYYWIRLPEYLNTNNIFQASKLVKNINGLELDKLTRRFVTYPGIRFRDKLTWFLIKNNMLFTYYFLYIHKNFRKK